MHSSDKMGFTIIEVMIAIVVLSFGLLAIGSLSVSNIKSNQFAGQMTAATTLAQDKIEALKNASYGSISTLTETNIDEEGNSGGIFNRVTTVTSDSPALNMKTVNVKVTWNWNGSQHDVELNTIIANIDQ